MENKLGRNVMDVNEYQALAAETIQFDRTSPEAMSIALLGLSGEVGELAAEFKKKMRDGESYKIFREKVIEELADIFWYLSTIATLEDIELDEVLKFSSLKIKERWQDLNPDGQLSFEDDFPDDGFPEDEQFPREFVAEFSEIKREDGKLYASIKINGEEFGNELRDNAYEDDFYRFHDIFHLSYVVTLGWSPVVRKFLGRKRKTVDAHDEIEDGGRATVIDEAISILVFEYARNHNFFEGTDTVDYQLLRTIKMLTRHLEIKNCTAKQWEHAILTGFKVWRKLRDSKKGRIICSMHEKTMLFEELSTD